MDTDSDSGFLSVFIRVHLWLDSSVQCFGRRHGISDAGAGDLRSDDHDLA